MSQTNDKILTAAEVAAIAKTWAEASAPGGGTTDKVVRVFRVNYQAVCDSHEALRRHVAELERQLAELKDIRDAEIWPKEARPYIGD